MNNKARRARLDPEIRKQQILDAAINLSIQKGYRQLTRQSIANKICCAGALINHYYGNIDNLRDIVLQIAIEKEIMPILAENYGTRGKETSHLPTQLKEKVINYLMN